MESAMDKLCYRNSFWYVVSKIRLINWYRVGKFCEGGQRRTNLLMSILSITRNISVKCFAVIQFHFFFVGSCLVPVFLYRLSSRTDKWHFSTNLIYQLSWNPSDPHTSCIHTFNLFYRKPWQNSQRAEECWKINQVLVTLWQRGEERKKNREEKCHWPHSSFTSIQFGISAAILK